MLLVNTIFFNGTWAKPFNHNMTRNQTFNQLGGASSQVDMMNIDQTFMYKRDDSLRVDVIVLPFKGNRFGLYIALPHDVDGVNALESSLSANVDSLFQGLKMTNLNVDIPKFKVESTLSLNGPLSTMGIHSAFNPNTADFSDLSKTGIEIIDRKISFSQNMFKRKYNNQI
ncbi:plasminogen activator inhibitor 1-like [Aplysia californica]|uniref:Plasminogen activator inhibitor 1-like n=1 Tax=Aplysia californica TaxID=6500 RepID=A0ABM0JSR6_APLCA|nr:plasminogen activator inhibitor 1-like [Aplysia californica]